MNIAEGRYAEENGRGGRYVFRQTFIKDANSGLLSRENNNLKLMLYLKSGASFVLTGMKILFLSQAEPQIPENAKFLLIISECEPGRLHGNLEGNKINFLLLLQNSLGKKICKYLTANNHIAKNQQTKPFYSIL